MLEISCRSSNVLLMTNVDLDLLVDLKDTLIIAETSCNTRYFLINETMTRGNFDLEHDQEISQSHTT